MTSNLIDLGRGSFARKAWAEAHRYLSAAHSEGLVDPDDLVLLSMAAVLVGRDTEGADVLAQAHQRYFDRGNIEQAARSAFWLGFQLVNTGHGARGGGWLARARRLIDDACLESVVNGYLLLPVARRDMDQGDVQAALEAFTDAVAIGTKFGDGDLIALARHGQGRALLRLGRIGEGVALLDEVMVGALATPIAPITVGVVYCSVVDACQEIFDWRRAQEWTTALTEWCAQQPDVVPFRGQCLIHRSQILQLHGAWADAMGAALMASERLADPPGQWGLGAACYQRAELHRLRGEFSEAEEAYRQASRNGRMPQPGLALLRLARGKVAAAARSIARAAEETRGSRLHVPVLSATVEILLADADVPNARAAAERLAEIAERIGAPYLRALSAQAMGAVLLAAGEPETALASLGLAVSLWREIEAPYEAARARVLIALANRAVGDDDTAAMELEAARMGFEQLGAATDVLRVDRLTGQSGHRGADGLTARERQVLGLIATGKTNRAIAQRLGISEKTVARHVSNVFLKLNLSSRAAATAYAYEHDLRSFST